MQLLDGQEQVEASELQVIDTREIEIATDGTLLAQRFELNPETVGRRKLAVTCACSHRDQNEADNFRSTPYEVVAKKN